MRQKTIDSIRFRMIELKYSQQDNRLAVIRKTTRPRAFPFFDAILLLDKMNKQEGTSVKIVSAVTAMRLLTNESWNAWIEAVGNVSSHADVDILFPAMPFVAFEKPGKKLKEEVGFKPDFDLYDDVPIRFRNDLRAFFVVPPDRIGNKHLMFAIQEFYPADFRRSRKDYLMSPEADKVKIFENVPDMDDWCEFDEQTMVPLRVSKDTGLPYFHIPNHAYVGPMFFELDLFERTPLRREIHFDWDWSRPSPIIVEIPVADISKIEGRINIR